MSAPGNEKKTFFNKAVIIPFVVSAIAITCLYYFFNKAPLGYSIIAGIIISFFTCFGLAFIFSGWLSRIVSRFAASNRREEIDRWHQLLLTSGFTVAADKLNIDISGNNQKITAQFSKSGHYFFVYGATKNNADKWSRFPHLKVAEEFKDGVLIEAKKGMPDDDVINFLRQFVK